MLMKPSFFMICIAQSIEPLYATPPPEVKVCNAEPLSSEYNGSQICSKGDEF